MPRCAAAGLVPTDEAHLVFAAQEEIVGDEEVARIGVLRPDAHADVFEAAVADCEGDRAHHFLFARKDRDLRIAERQAFEDVVLRGHHVEELVIARAVEDCLSVARAFDGDGLLRRAFQGKRPRPGEWRAERVDVVQRSGR